MEHKTLSCEARTELGKGASRRYRMAGKIPAVIYGHQEPMSILVDAREFRQNFKTISESTIIELSVGKETFQVLVKDFQQNLIKDSIEHIDFYEVEKGKALRTHVPVVLEGSAPGTKVGGTLEQKIEMFEIECLPKDLVEKITIDVSALELGASIHVRDVVTAEGVQILDAAERTVATVTRPKGESSSEEEAGEDAAE
ncbi:MAG: 50S ribosomal protein L25, partial [Spirochaetales bacterium]|nr:50S ribosomal protein L25 [Spirochaetales bacterium]